MLPRTAPVTRMTPKLRVWLAQAGLIRKRKAVRRRKRGPHKTPTKKLVSLRLSPQVVEHLRSTGPGWQTRMNETLVKAISQRA